MKPTKARLLCLFAAAFCAGHVPAAQDAISPVPAAETAPGAVSSPNYILLPNDMVFIKVFQEDDLNSTLRISEDGTIAFPLIGNVKIGGLTVQDASQAIRRRLDARFLVNPQVTLTVLKFSNRIVTVLGQVQKPGSYGMRDLDSIDLMQAIGLAGGFTRLANASRITVKRSVGGHEVVTVLDGKKMARDKVTTPFVILPGDIISVSERIF
jgi:polysaccharide export outer membrane protein